MTDHDLTARIHSLESFGTLDGPGMRCVVFFQGCAYRCLYCHNPDTWRFDGGQEVSLEALLAEVRGLARFIKKRGGVTASGGDPLLQPRFVSAFFRRLKAEGYHTALDTSGLSMAPEALDVLDYTDLVLLDLKGMGDDLHRRMTGHAGDVPRRFADEVRRRGIPLWLRFVLVPGLTDDEAHLRTLADYAATFPSAERLEILPFHKMGEFKWTTLGLPYTLQDVPEPSPEALERARACLRTSGLKVV